MMAHAQKPNMVFQQNGQVHLLVNRWGCQFSRLLAVEECGSADSNCIDHVPTYRARLLATHSIRIFPLQFPSRASLCAIRFRTRYTKSLSLHTNLKSGLCCIVEAPYSMCNDFHNLPCCLLSAVQVIKFRVS